MDLVLPPLRPYQRPILTSRALDDFTISAPQIGKTLSAATWLFTAAYLHGPDHRPWWWTAPTYGQLMHGFEMIERFAVDTGMLAKATTSHPFPRIKLDGGERFEFRSWERPDNLRGPTVLGGVSDEFGVGLTKRAYSAISSRRRHTIPQGLGYWRWIGNVGDIGGEAERMWKNAEAGGRQTAHRRWTWRDGATAYPCYCECDGGSVPIELGTGDRHHGDCARGMYVRGIEDEAAVMSGPQFRREYDAEWADWSELPVYTFDRAIHVSEAVHDDPALPLDLAVDFNVDPMCWVIGQHKGEEAWAFDELVLEGGTTTAEACQELIRRHGNPKRDLTIYGDAAGNARTTKAKHTDYDVMRSMLPGAFRQVRIDVPAANPPVRTRVEAFNTRLRSAKGEVRYYLHPRCVWGADDMARTSWKSGTSDIDKSSNKQRTHWSDAEGYRMARLYNVEKRARVVVSSTKPLGTGNIARMAN